MLDKITTNLPIQQLCLKRRRDTNTPQTCVFLVGLFFHRRGNKAIRFIDMNGSGKLCPNCALSSKEQTESLTLEGSVTTLLQHLAHLEQIVRKITHLDCDQIEPPLRNPDALCVTSDEVSVCADNEKRAIFQVALEKDGVAIRGKSLIFVEFPADVAAIELLAVCGRLVYFVSGARELLVVYIPLI